MKYRIRSFKWNGGHTYPVWLQGYSNLLAHPIWTTEEKDAMVFDSAIKAEYFYLHYLTSVQCIIEGADDAEDNQASGLEASGHKETNPQESSSQKEGAD